MNDKVDHQASIDIRFERRWPAGNPYEALALLRDEVYAVLLSHPEWVIRYRVIAVRAEES